MYSSFLNCFMSQNWEDLVMLHYRQDVVSIQDTLPDDLEVDTFDGCAWLSVVGFRLSNLRIRPLTFLKWSDFWEVNLRTYIKDKTGRKGVWFYSLDSNDPFGVFGARLLYGLRYFNARIDRLGDPQIGEVSFSSTRKDGAGSRIEAAWNVDDIGTDLAKEQLDQFLLERYRFWARRSWDKKSTSAKVKHQPYDAVRLRKSYYQGELFSTQGLNEPEKEPEFGHYCPGFPVEATAPAWAFSISGQANQR